MIKTNNGSCPCCGGQLIVDVLYQYSKRRKILKNGKESKKYTIHDLGPEEAEIIWCADCETQFEDYDRKDDGRITVYYEE